MFCIHTVQNKQNVLKLILKNVIEDAVVRGPATLVPCINFVAPEFTQYVPTVLRLLENQACI